MRNYPLDREKTHKSFFMRFLRFRADFWLPGCYDDYYLHSPLSISGGFSCPILFGTAEPGILDFRFWQLPVNRGATLLARDASFLVYRLRNCSTGHLILFQKATCGGKSDEGAEKVSQ